MAKKPFPFKVCEQCCDGSGGGTGGGSYSDWSEEDKQAVIDDVIAALPDADTMSFPLENPVSEVSEE